MACGTVLVDRVAQAFTVQKSAVNYRHLEVRGFTVLGVLTSTLGQLPSNITVVSTV